MFFYPGLFLQVGEVVKEVVPVAGKGLNHASDAVLQHGTYTEKLLWGVVVTMLVVILVGIGLGFAAVKAWRYVRDGETRAESSQKQLTDSLSAFTTSFTSRFDTMNTRVEGLVKQNAQGMAIDNAEHQRHTGFMQEQLKMAQAQAQQLYAQMLDLQAKSYEQNSASLEIVGELTSAFERFNMNVTGLQESLVASNGLRQRDHEEVCRLLHAQQQQLQSFVNMLTTIGGQVAQLPVLIRPGFTAPTSA